MSTRWVFLAAALWVGCGYRFAAGGAPFPGGLRTAYVPVFSNSTAEPGVEVFFTESLREQLIRAGREGGRRAEARIEGEVRAVSGAPGVQGPGGQGARNRLSAVVHLTLRQSSQVMAEFDVAGSEDYFADPDADVLKGEASRQAALRRLADSLMREGYERLASGG